MTTATPSASSGGNGQSLRTIMVDIGAGHQVERGWRTNLNGVDYVVTRVEGNRIELSIDLPRVVFGISPVKAGRPGLSMGYTAQVKTPARETHRDRNGRIVHRRCVRCSSINDDANRCTRCGGKVQ